MERFVTVNDFSSSPDVNGLSVTETGPDAGTDSEPLGSDAGWESSGSALPVAPKHDQGPCLYLGPQGQRCSEPAVAGGFCSRHQTGKTQAASRRVPRVVAAGLGILAATWPLLADLLREVFRWIHAH